jgi:hypothetical protein
MEAAKKKERKPVMETNVFMGFDQNGNPDYLKCKFK